MKTNALARFFLAGAAVLTLASWSNAQQAATDLAPPTLLTTADGKPIDTIYWSIPTIADIDNDGQKDVVVGQFMNHKAPWLRKHGKSGSNTSGTATWYRNLAKKAGQPSYATGVDIKSDDGLLYAPNW